MSDDFSEILNELGNRILLRAYDVWREPGGSVDARPMVRERNWDRGTNERLWWKLKWSPLLLSGGPSEWSFSMTSRGLAYLEQAGLIPAAAIDENRKCRLAALRALAAVFKTGGLFATVLLAELSKTVSQQERVLRMNLAVLSDAGLVIVDDPQGYRISLPGVDHLDRVEAFEKLSRMLPQPRGRALQRFLAKVIQRNGWKQDEGVRTSNEELDIVISKRREYYLLECKWENKRIGASVIREVFGKLGNRADVRGIVISMSGFTKGAVKQVEKYANSKLILIFGEDDTRSMVYEYVSFDTLLDRKYRELVEQGKASFA